MLIKGQFLDVYLPPNPKGRIPILSERQYALAMAQIEKRTAEGLCFALGSAWLRFIEPYIRATMVEYGIPNAGTKPLTCKMETVERLYRKMCDGKVYQGDKQERARICARADIIRHILEGAAREAMLTGPDRNYSGPDAIRAGFLYSEDTVSDFVEDNGKFKKCALRGSKKVMKENKKVGFGTKALSSAGTVCRFLIILTLL